MPVVDIVALVLGVVIMLVAAALAAGETDTTDQSMRWEGGVALGFTGLVVAGPFWIAQAVLTVIATFRDGGIAPGWLWAWLLLAPVAGAVLLKPLAAAVLRILG